MKIKKIKLLHYRNYEKLELDFSSTLNLIYGDNGSGKTNLIEAIYLLALTKSFRTSNDFNMIKSNSNQTTVTGEIDDIKYQIEIFDGGKKVYIDNDKIDKLSKYIGQINLILFNPLDTKVITDSPATRRRMLDIEISQISQDYLIILANYNRILKHRNAYLKQLFLNGNSSGEYLDILTKKLIEYGVKIYEIRDNYIKQINDNITKIYENIFNYGNLTIKYHSDYSNKNVDKLLKMYQKNYKKEMAYGKTLEGIHHDDIEFMLDEHNIKIYGSIGQQKNSIISFKLAELLIIKKIKGEYPILILDDLFSELDNNKVNNILKMLNKEVQTFITTTNIESIQDELIKDGTLFKVNYGSIERKDL